MKEGGRKRVGEPQGYRHGIGYACRSASVGTQQRLLGVQEPVCKCGCQ